MAKKKYTVGFPPKMYKFVNKTETNKKIQHNGKKPAEGFEPGAWRGEVCALTACKRRPLYSQLPGSNAHY